MKFLSSAVIALIGSSTLAKKSHLKDEGSSNSTTPFDEDDSVIDGLSSMNDKPMGMNVISGLTQGQTVSSEVVNIPVAGAKTEFKNDYDHEAHKSEALKIDYDKVILDKTLTKEGRLCQADEWAVVKWKSFSLETGKETTSNYQNPTAWKIGEYKVSKCWEIAVSQMRANEKATITCPRSLVDEGLDKSGDVYNSELGRKYEFEVLECDKYPAFFKPEKLLETKCFYIKVSGIDGQGSNLALTVD